MSKVLLSLNDMPPVIRESVRAVLIAHGSYIVQLAGVHGHPNISLAAVKLTDKQLDGLLREIANNVAQALVLLDQTPDETDDVEIKVEVDYEVKIS